MKKYYEMLGLPLGASQTDIKKQFRKIANEHHPDKNKGADPKRFQELTQAYNILVGKDKMSRHEQREHEQSQQKSKLEEQWRRQEADLQNEARAKKVARDAAKWAARERAEQQSYAPPKPVARPRVAQTYYKEVYDTCRTCNGLGSIREICSRCYGTGNIVGENRRPVQSCATCSRVGHIKRTSCATCEGNGRIYLGKQKVVIWE